MVGVERRGATVETDVPHSSVATRRGASVTLDRGMNPTATVGASPRDANGARPSGRFNVIRKCNSRIPKTMRAMKGRKRRDPGDRIWSRTIRGVGFIDFVFLL